MRMTSQAVVKHPWWPLVPSPSLPWPCVLSLIHSTTIYWAFILLEPVRSKLRFWSSANSQTFIFSFKPLLTWKIPVLETPLPRPVVNSASVGSSPSWVRPREGRCTVSAAQPGPSCPISGGCSGKSVFPQRSGPLRGGTVIRSICVLTVALNEVCQA